jgi:hypothetical protein
MKLVRDEKTRDFKMNLRERNVLDNFECVLSDQREPCWCEFKSSWSDLNFEWTNMNREWPTVFLS